jgi:lipooligosaccharide transport system ATP-binding protein
MTEPLVSARALTKRFDDFVAVDAIDFDVQPGEAFGFLGPNGAGKSSTMRMIGAVSPVSGGTLTVLGLDPDRDGAAIRARLGVVPQENNLDPELPVEENLLIYGRYFDLPRAVIRERIDELLAFAELTDRRRDVVDHLSGGMKRRLTIARALINQPDLVLLDEPTTGLDPQARHVLWDRLYRLKERGATLIITTHYMDEAEQLCDRLVVMDKGVIAAEGSPRELITRYATREVVELRFPVGAQDAALARLDGLGTHLEVLPDRVLISADDGDAIVSGLEERSVSPASLVVRRSSLEDVFLRLTGRTLVD